MSFLPAKRKTISIIIPFFNEEENIQRIYEELNEARSATLSGYDFEILFMDNHSSDKSFAVACKLAEQDPSVTVLRLSRNFGYQSNILTGFLNCTGDAAVQLDADGEDDPMIIARFVEYWEKGFDVVYGVRRQRVEGGLITFQRKLFYRILSSLAAVDIPVDAGDFRLLSRNVLEGLRQCPERGLYIRGMISYLGFEQIGIPYDRRPRYKGVSKFNWWGYMTLAVEGITAFSKKPLMLAVWAGLGLAVLSFIAGFVYLVLFLTLKITVPGFTTLVILILFLAGVQLICMGILGLYIGTIFEEVKQRPRSLIAERVSQATNVSEHPVS